MKKFPIVLDLETKYSFKDYTDPKKLGVTVVATYNYADKKSKVFTEKDINSLFPLLENCSYIIGYNINHFDLPVLQAYYAGNVKDFSTFDILEDIRNKIGKRLALNDLIYPTLGKKKTGHGLHAIQLYNEGRLEELKRYCLDDVLLTKELFEYGAKNEKIFYLNEYGKVPINVEWKKYLEENKNDIPLTLPF